MARDPLTADRLDEPRPEASRVEEVGLPDPFQERAHQLEARGQQVLHPEREELAGTGREVMTKPTDERPQGPARRHPASGLLRREPKERTERSAEERAVGGDRRVVADRLPEPEELTRRLAGGDEGGVDAARRRARDHRRSVGEAGILQQPLVDADVEGAPCPTPRQHETQGPRSSPFPPDPHHPLPEAAADGLRLHSGSEGRGQRGRHAAG